ncbi:MAG TPA: CDP-diacylglycerol diphosphatase [Xanthobacteraceae bacterium]|nr:CDP-diacylglycerol diphosphatase [Xanthobacteraceae bacterium]
MPNVVPPARRFGRGMTLCAVWAVVAWAVLTPPAGAADPDTLWKIVNGQCVPNQQRHHNPEPCTEVDIRSGVARGHVVLKDIRGDTQYLVIPTARVTGIESPALLAPGAPNYWAPAWKARRHVVARAGRPLPRDAIALAVNSQPGRSQNQLHIHVDCVRPDVRDYLLKHAGKLSSRWSASAVPFDGHAYRLLRVDSADLRGVDPFRLLARGIPGARAEMGDWSLVVVGLEPRGFVVLAGHVDAAKGDRASGEELMDHDCALARSLPRGK